MIKKNAEYSKKAHNHYNLLLLVGKYEKRVFQNFYTNNDANVNSNFDLLALFIINKVNSNLVSRYLLCRIPRQLIPP